MITVNYYAIMAIICTLLWGVLSGVRKNHLFYNFCNKYNVVIKILTTIVIPLSIIFNYLGSRTELPIGVWGILAALCSCIVLWFIGKTAICYNYVLDELELDLYNFLEEEDSDIYVKIEKIKYYIDKIKYPAFLILSIIGTVIITNFTSEFSLIELDLAFLVAGCIYIAIIAIYYISIILFGIGYLIYMLVLALIEAYIDRGHKK